MDNYITLGLQKFEKPDKNFIKEKECLICLEPIDKEPIQNIVKLPCNCNSSVYHINCIIQLLNSGQNKNFCPHCKKTYEIPQSTVKIKISFTQVLPYNTTEEDNNIPNIREINLIYIYIFHIVTNSLLNIINITISIDYNNNKNKKYIILKILIILYFFKLFINFCIILKIKDYNEKIEKFYIIVIYIKQ